MKKEWAQDRIPKGSSVIAAATGYLAAAGVMGALLGSAAWWLGLLWALLAAALGAWLTARLYRSIRNTVQELDRACRTRLLEKYLGGDIPPEGDLTEAMPGVESEYFAVAMVQCIDFTSYLPDCGAEHIPHENFLAVDNWMRDSVSRRLEGISRPYFVPITDGMMVLINVTGLEESRLTRAPGRRWRTSAGPSARAPRTCNSMAWSAGRWCPRSTGAGRTSSRPGWRPRS